MSVKQLQACNVLVNDFAVGLERYVCHILMLEGIEGGFVPC